MTAQRTNVVNGYASVLASPMGATATSLIVASASGVTATPFYLVIDPENAQSHREVILVDTSVVGTTFTLSSTAKRYLSGSAAGSGLAHSAGEVVKICVVEQLFDDLNDRIDATYQPAGTDVAVADGGTGASTQAGARANLALVYDVNVATPALVAAETTRAQAAEATLTTNVATNTSGLAAELVARAAADTALGVRVDNVLSPARFGVHGGGAGQSIANNTATAMSFTGGAEDYDSGSHLASGVFTADSSTAGLWLFTFCVSFVSNATGVRSAWLEHSSGTRRYGKETMLSVTAAGSADMSGSAMIPVANGETVSLIAYQTSGGALAVGSTNESSFQGRYLGPA